jgi:CHAT domain-containing protein/Tfp pilus assembly protein PilF
MKNFKKLRTKALIYVIFTFYFFNINLFSLNYVNLRREFSQLFLQAEQFRLNGEFEKSLKFFEKSLYEAKKGADEREQCEVYFKLGLIFWNIGQLKKSMTHYEDSLSLAKKLNLKTIQNKCQIALEIHEHYKRGKDSRALGELQSSIENFEKALNLAKKLKSKEHELKCLLQLSSTYWMLNKSKDFLLLNEQALSIARLINHKKQEGICLYNIGYYYYEFDNYSKALSFYEEALIIAQLLLNKEDESDCLNNIGITYEKIGNYDKASEYLAKALHIYEQLKDDGSISMVFNNMGTTYRTKGLFSKAKEDFLKALKYFEDCLSLAKKSHNQITEVQALNNIGTVYTDLGNLSDELAHYYDALKYFQSAHVKAKEINDEEAKGMTLTNIGIVHSNLGNIEESTKYYENAIDLALEIEGNKILWEAYLELAKVYEQQEKFNEAIERYKASIDTTEKIRSRIVLENLKAKFLGTDKRIEAYHRLINLLVKLFHDTKKNEYAFEAFDYLERAKARAFLDSLELSRVDISEDIDAEFVNKEKELEKNITSIYSKLLATELTLENRNSLHEELKNYENELDSLKREIRKESPAYANLRYPEIITLNETQKNLIDTKTAIFAYSLGQENSYAFAITKNDLKIFQLPGRDNIKNKIQDYLKVITDKDNRNFQLGNELFNNLVLPGLDKNIKNIIFVPDDILHFLPFETLLTDNEKNGWLVKDYQIAYAPSISSLREIIEHKKSNKQKPRMDLLAFGDPSFGTFETGNNGTNIFEQFFSSRSFDFFRLEFSGLEIDQISSLFKKKKIFRRNEASEDQLKNHNLEDYKIIHFATHSIINESRPDRSSIVFTLDEDPAEDGFFQMREIYKTKLNSDLVTLSIEGINRAFFYAGASSVLMSLWAVNDQASCQLMERFYVHLRSSESIMNALRKAKLELIESDPLSHPYYWAGFIASGKADEIIFPRTSSNWIFLGAFLVLVFGAIMILRKRFRKEA